MLTYVYMGSVGPFENVYVNKKKIVKLILILILRIVGKIITINGSIQIFTQFIFSGNENRGYM